MQQILPLMLAQAPRKVLQDALYCPGLCGALKPPCSATDAFYLPDFKEALSCENVSLAIPDTLEGAETPVMEIPSSCSVSHHVLTPSHHPPGHEAEVNDAAPLLLRCGIVL